MVATQIDMFQDFADFIAALSPEKLLTYYAPPKLQTRVEQLVDRKKNGNLTAEESFELEKYFVFEHLVRLAKTRALSLVSKNPVK